MDSKAHVWGGECRAGTASRQKEHTHGQGTGGNCVCSRSFHLISILIRKIEILKYKVRAMLIF